MDETTAKAISPRERGQQEKLARGLMQTLRDTREDEREAETTLTEAAMVDAVRARATDIHLDPHGGRYRLRFRIDGVMVDAADLHHEDGLQLVNQFRVLARLDPVTAMIPDAGHFSYLLDEAALDLRVTVAPCIAGDKLAIRMLAPARMLQKVRDLGLAGQQLELLERWLETVGGMLLISGPTGSGKTTTLYSLLHQLKMTDRHIVTLEDPVEYEIPGINQMRVDVERGLDFAAGAQAMLRLDPDYLVIGELTEAGSARAAMNAASGGKATLSTLHSRDAADVISVMRNYGLDDFELAANLQLVVAQRLVRRLCVHCRRQDAPGKADVRWLKSLELPVPDSAWTAAGCEQCNDLGYYGRIGIFEVWRPDDEDYTKILDHRSAHEIRAGLAEREHCFLLEDGLAKAEQGLVSYSELYSLGALSARTARQQPTLVAK